MRQTIQPLEPGPLRNHVRPFRPALLSLGFTGLIWLTTISLASPQEQYAEPYTFVTLAGRYQTGIPLYPVGGYADGTGTNALFSYPSGLAVDKTGNLFVTDSYNSLIRRVSPVREHGQTNWVVTTIAGRIIVGDGYISGGYADGVGTNALFNWPNGIALDGAGRLYVADADNCVIRMLTPTPTQDSKDTNWVVTTLAGQFGTRGHRDGTNTDATFELPTGIAIDPAGDLTVSDNSPGVLRRIKHQGTNWIVTTVAGAGTAPWDINNPLADGLGTNAQFQFLGGVTVDAFGDTFVADPGNNAIRKVSPVGTDWLVTTLAGGGPSLGLLLDGPRGFGFFAWPEGVAVDPSGRVFVADTGNAAIRKVTPDGIVSTIAGRESGAADGTGTGALFRSPVGIATGPDGRLYVVDHINGNIRMGWPYEPPPQPGIHGPPEIITQPQSQTVAATYDALFSVAITNAHAAVYQWRKDDRDIPGATNAVLSITNVDLSDSGTYQVLVSLRRETHPHPNPHTLQSAPASLRVIMPYTFTSLAGWLEPGLTNGTGNQARFDFPMGMAIDGQGTVYLSDYANSVLRAITRSGVVSTLTPWETSGPGVPLGGRPASFTLPTGLAIDRGGNLYLASFDHTIKKLTFMGTNWLVSTIAGIPFSPGAADGIGPQARFYSPIGLAIDSATNLYVVDSLNSTVRKITPLGADWYVTTLAGTPGVSGLNDGTNGDAQFTFPRGIAVNSVGDLFVADLGNHAIRHITPAGVVTTIAGSRTNIGSADGYRNAAQFLFPSWVVIDDAGALYVADHYNSAIRRVVQSGTNWLVTTIAGHAGHEGQADGTGNGVQFVFPGSIALDGAGNLYVADAFNIIRKGWRADAPPAIVVSPPVISPGAIQLDFALSTGPATSFTLLQSDQPGGEWSRAPAILTTNVPGVSYSFTLPQPQLPARFYRVRIP
ncbi:MAG TPA: immunoglobulin domain-containing protein [Verrucomicrobiae bacterium]|nr:immunoglobulin domain-containing protein [Verrucomicrobiae bacterium]